MIVLKRIKTANKQILTAINFLLPQLSSTAKKLPMLRLSQIAKDKNTIFIGVWDGKNMIGMGFIIFILTPAGFRARIEDVVIDERHRGHGLGDKLTRLLISEARKKRVSYIELTSRPNRVAANRLYRRLGFKRHHTSMYRLV